MKSEYVYHSSGTEKLKRLKPNISTHGKNWIYATKDLVMSAVFLSKHGGDFCCQVGREKETDKVYICERYKNAFDEGYENKKGSIYILRSQNFIENMTQWTEEVISAKPEEVVEEIKIENVKTYLLEIEKQGKLIIKRYPNKIDSIPTDDSDLFYKSINWIQRGGFKLEEKIKKKFPHLTEKISTELSRSPFETFISLLHYEYRNDVDYIFKISIEKDEFTITELFQNAWNQCMDKNIKEIFIHKNCKWFNTKKIKSSSIEDSMLKKYEFNDLNIFLNQLINENKIAFKCFNDVIKKDHIQYLKDRIGLTSSSNNNQKLKEMIAEHDRSKIKKYHSEIYDQIYR